MERIQYQPTPSRRHETPSYEARPQRIQLSEQVQRMPDVISRIDAALSSETRTNRSGVIFDRGQEKKSSGEYFLSSDWLKEEVAKESQKPVLPGETPWYHLSGTGFWIEPQVRQFLSNVSEVGKEVFPDVLAREQSKIKLDIEHFEQEYLKQMASLTFNLSWQERDGEKRIVCTDYTGGAEKDKNGVLWESVTSPLERDGAVYDTLFGNKEKGTIGVEERLKTAEPGTMAIMVSPSGWSGWTIEGEPYDYSETQVYALLKKKDGSLQAYTFRYDATIEENEMLQKTLGLEIPGYAGERDRIKKMVTNVAFIEPIDAVRAELAGKTPIRGFEDLLNAMQQTVGGREVMYDGDGSPKRFVDVHGLLKNPEGFTKRHPLTPKLIDEVLSFFEWRLQQGGDMRDIERDLQIGLAAVILRLNRAYRDGEKESGGVSVHIKRMKDTEPAEYLDKLLHGGMDYGAEAQDLQSRPGCGGGGGASGNKMSITSMGTLRTVEKSGEGDYDFDHDGTCVVCNTGPKPLGPCEMCISCDASFGGKGASMIADESKQEDLALAA